jgi:hypothetical protein
VIFRPGSKGPDHLTMSWKWSHGRIAHVDVLERDKPADGSLGRQLVIGYAEGRSEGEVFDALDEIQSSYVVPICDAVAEACAHRKFLDATTAEVSAILLAEKAEAPASIPYRVSFAERVPVALQLTFLPGKGARARVCKELVLVRPDGFQLSAVKHVTHATLDQLLVWFKQNLPVSPAPRRAHASSLPRRRAVIGPSRPARARPTAAA